MLLRNIKLVVLVMAMVLCCATRGFAWQMLYGDVVQVFPEQNQILLQGSNEKTILDLTDDCVILREGKPTLLQALRPITVGVYQDALCWVDNSGVVNYILVNYKVQEDEQGRLLNYDIFGNLK